MNTYYDGRSKSLLRGVFHELGSIYFMKKDVMIFISLLISTLYHRYSPSLRIEKFLRKVDYIMILTIIYYILYKNINYLQDSFIWFLTIVPTTYILLLIKITESENSDLGKIQKILPILFFVGIPCLADIYIHKIDNSIIVSSIIFMIASMIFYFKLKIPYCDPNILGSHEIFHIMSLIGYKLLL